MFHMSDMLIGKWQLSIQQIRSDHFIDWKPLLKEICMVVPKKFPNDVYFIEHGNWEMRIGRTSQNNKKCFFWKLDARLQEVSTKPVI
jgi:hypothetical protein